MGQSPSSGVHRLPAGRAGGAALLCVLLGMTVWTAQAAGAGAPLGLPGPPPGAGAGFPLPPPPGRGPGIQPVGPPATIPLTVSGPGLLSGTASLRGTRFTVQIACQAGGNVAVSVPAVGRGTLAQTRYACSKRRANVRVSLPTAVARRVAAMGEALAGLSFGQGKRTERLSLTLQTHPQPASFWLSDDGLRCDVPGSNTAQLLAPNFTDTPATTIDVRPWVAWYTAATGWRWLGTAGVNASRWYRWTATPDGVAEWQTGGVTSPWTWSPISVAAGHGTYVIAVFEAIYWYSHPTYVWSYARSSTGGNPATTYCAYR
jgi:hypothetical protein